MQLVSSVSVCYRYTETLNAADILKGSHTIKSIRTQVTKSLWRRELSFDPPKSIHAVKEKHWNS